MVVWGECSGGAVTVGGFVVPDRGGEREDSLEDAGTDPGAGPAAVSFEVKLAFEGLVH